MFLSWLGAPVPQQRRDAANGRPSQLEFYGVRISNRVGMSPNDPGSLEQSLELPLPVSGYALTLAIACPEKVLRPGLNGFESFHHEVRKWTEYWNAGLCRVQGAGCRY